MATILTQTQPEITIIGGHAVTTSIAVAEYFQKPHKDVLAKLSRLECSPEFTERNFSLSSYIDSTGRKLPCYHITRDGFAFLAMGFTGKKAAKFKEDYISAFNSMEQHLLKQHNAIVAPINGRVLTYYENGVVREQRIISSDQHIATLEEFLEMAERAKYLVIDIDRLKEISLTGRVKP